MGPPSYGNKCEQVGIVQHVQKWADTLLPDYVVTVEINIWPHENSN